MLEVLNLTKIFNSKKREKTIALDNVSFKLPDNGCVFVVGKSGSGKTTLLSLLGGLDDITSGEIIYNGHKLSNFKHNEFDVYRNNEVGFIFQDYHLLEELTIFDNIKMMLDFKKIDDDNLIHEALKAVDLEGYENRYPKELSGGEKQRVAIARIIVKNPSIILADEPTGNLDINTTKLVLSLLKKMSTNKLVIIVSHNNYDAYEYSDYILELDNGKIINKYKKDLNCNYSYRVENQKLYLSKNKNISESELQNLKTSLKSTKIVDIEQNNYKFVEYNEDFDSKNQDDVKLKKHISFKNLIKYSHKFFRGSLIKSLIFGLIGAGVISSSAICQSLTNVNADDMITNTLSKRTHKTAYVGSKNDTFSSDIVSSHFPLLPENYKDIYNEHGYEGNIYEVSSGYMYVASVSKNNVVYTDPAFLAKIFSDNGELKFKVKREEEVSDGFYLTDFLYKRLTKDSYDNFTSFKNFSGFCLTINGIIDTNYEEKYKEFLPVMNNTANISDIEINDPIKEATFMEDFYNYFLNLYTFNENWREDYINNEDNKSYLFSHAVACLNGNKVHGGYQFAKQNLLPKLNINLKDDEILLSHKVYSRFKHDFDMPNGYDIYYIDNPFTVDIEFYQPYDGYLEQLIWKHTYKVVGVTAGGVNICNEKTIETIARNVKYTNALLFDNASNLEPIKKGNDELGIELNFYELTLIRNDVKFIDSLHDVFMFAFIVLLIISILLVCLFLIKSFNNKLFQIGVMKSLGARDTDTFSVIIFNTLFTLFSTLIFYNILEIFMIKFTNNVIKHGIESLSTKSGAMELVDVLFIKPDFFVVSNLLIVVCFAVCLLVLYFKIRRLKPIKIIKAKE